MYLLVSIWTFLYLCACLIMFNKLRMDIYEGYENDEDGQTRKILHGWIRRVFILQYLIWPRSLMNYFRNYELYRQEE